MLVTCEKEELDKSQRNATGELSGYANHMADGGTDTIERQVSLGLMSNEEAILFKIDRALKRIEDNAYGGMRSCAKIKFRRNVLKLYRMQRTA